MIKKIQQGDVVFWEGEKVPDDGKVLKTTIVRHGESGNAHCIKSGECDLIEKDGVLYYVAKTKTIITHDGPHKPHHGTVVLPAKTSGRVGTIYESNPFDEQIRAIRD
jgi:hypothetical protein